MASTTIWLARHGEVHNPGNVLYGRLPRMRLTPEGRRQAQALADFLAPRKLAAIESRYGDAHLGTLDGISVDYPDWHFNVRASNTEPLLRLNLEAKTPELMERKRDEVLHVIRG